MITRLNISRSKSLGQEYLSSKVNKCALLGPVLQDSPITTLAKDCDDGLKRFVEPVKALDCLSGTYFLRDRNKRFKLVFKPCDEENITRSGFSEGGGMLRELIAFLLDKSFANVPHTQLAEVVYRPFCASDSPSLPVCKRGSVQQYVRAECCADDMGACRFEAEDVHRIAVMDIRLCNLDRHAGNILCVRENGGPSSLNVDWGGVSLSVDSGGQSLASSAPASFSFEALLLLADEDSSPPRVSPKGEVAKLRLVPIDHGYTLPHLLFLGDAHFAWLHWPQASLPLSEKTMRYVQSIDVEADIRAIETAVGAGALEPASLLTLRVCTHFLQSGLLHGLTLSELGALMTAGDEEDSISALQSLVNEDVACLARFLASGSPRSVFDVHNTSSQFSMGQFGSGLGVALEHIMASKSEGLLVLKIKESIDALFAHKISRSLKRNV